jgi:hypothetical protein
MCEIEWLTVLEYLKVLLSWPPLLFVSGLLLAKRFDGNIRKLIDRVKSIGYPGGTATLTEVAQKVEAANPPSIDLPGADAAPIPQAPAADPLAEVVNREFPQDLAVLLPNANIGAAIEYARTNPGPTVSDFVEMAMRAGFERTFNLIYGTQTRLLEFLRASNAAHPIPDIAPFFEEHKQLSGSDSAALPDFLHFLVSQGMLTNVGNAEGPLFRITEIGCRFLAHIKQYYGLRWDKQPY